jgi:AcrR family transcriptional regulator
MAVRPAPRRRTDRRERILEATLRVIIRDGLDGIRSSSVAREAGVSPALPHYYYPTLDDLVIAAYAYDEERTWREIPADGDPIEVLHGALSSFFAIPEEPRRAAMMLWHEYARRAVFDERVHDAVAPRIDRWGGAIAASVERLQADGRIPGHVESRLAMLLLLGAWSGQSALVLLDVACGEAAEADVRRQIDGLALWPRPARSPWRAPALASPAAEADEEERSDAILDAALRVMSRTGVKGVHFPEVAAEAGVSDSLPRYYFPTIDGLVAAAFRRSAMITRGRVLARAEQLDDPLDRLRDACAWETAGDPGDMHDAWIALSELLRRGFVGGDGRGPAEERLRTWIAYVAGLVGELQGLGRVGASVDPEAVASRLVAVELGLGLGVLFGVVSVDEFGWAMDAAIDLELGLGDLPVRP